MEMQTYGIKDFHCVNTSESLKKENLQIHAQMINKKFRLFMS